MKAKPSIKSPIILCCLLVVSLLSTVSQADFASARQAMEDQANPLLLMSTSQGPIYIELFPAEAPDNVSRFIELAEGQVEFFDEESNSSAAPRYYNGARFHRVVPNFVIQAGSAHYHPLGHPDEFLADEINANSLGLDRLPVLQDGGELNPLLNIESKEDFGRRVLNPIYRDMNITSKEALEANEEDVLGNLQNLTLMRLYEYEGFDYQNVYPTRGITRGVMALANDGPNRNGPEFFIALTDAEHLNGRHTVIGKVVEGLEVVDRIGSVAVDPLTTDPQSTRIFSVRKIN